MTASNPPTHRGWHRSERRFLPPFGDGSSPNQLSNLLQGLLARCRFSPFTYKALSVEPTQHISAHEFESVNPRFEVSVDWHDDLTNKLGLQRLDLELGLSARSQSLRRYDVLDRWPIDSLPTESYSPSSGKLQTLHSGQGIDFILALRVTARSKSLTRLGLGPGKVICRKEFSVRESTSAQTFPFRWVEFGGSTGFPAEMLWTIEWKHPDDDVDRYRRPVADVLTVLVNSKAEQPLSEMAALHGANDLGWKMLAADITTQIWTDVLANTDELPDLDDTATLVGQVFAHLHEVSGKPYQEIKRLGEQDDSLSELRSLIAALYKVVV